MRINNNITALQSYSNLLGVNKNISRSMQKLSSGIRLNSVKDDAAAYAISKKIAMQLGGLEKAGVNTMDGISIVQTGEGATQEIHNMLHRMRELAVQSSNDTNTPEDRDKMQAEIVQLKQEIDKIVDRTEFNNIKLLGGGASRMAKPNIDGVMEVISTSEGVTVGNLKFDIAQAGLPAYALASTSNLASPIFTGEESIDINGETIKFDETDTAESVTDKLRTAMDRVNIKAFGDNFNWANWQTGGTQLELVTKDAGSDQKISISGSPTALSKLGLSAVDKTGTDAEIKSTSLEYNGQKATYVSDGNRVEVTTGTGEKITFNLLVKEGATPGRFEYKNGALATSALGAVEIKMLDFGPLKIQIGANKLQEMQLNIPSISVDGLNLKNLTVASVYTSQQALIDIDKATALVSNVRSRLGAYQNRLEYTTKGLDATSEATAMSLSRIMDTDMAREMTELTQNNVIYQAGIAILGQANQRPEQILQLLR